MASLLLFLKAHNKGYTRKDGTHVDPFDDKRAPAKPEPPAALPKPAKNPFFFKISKQAAEDAWAQGKAPTNPKLAPKHPTGAQIEKEAALAAQASKPKWSALASMQSKPSKPTGGTGLFGGFMAPDHAKDLGQAPAKPAAGGGGQSSLFGHHQHKPLPSSAVAHPQLDAKGKTVMIHYPTKPSEPSTWTDPDAIATFTPGGAVPAELNGLALAPWADPPKTEEEWDYVEGQNDELEEPGMVLPQNKIPASGVVVLEPDGRCWIVAPTNRFGSTKATFPKGSRDYGLSLQANAIKECYEEAGLKVEIDSYLGDVTRTTSVARYYLARRVGGTPAAMGWESQAVHLVPAKQLVDFLDRGDDRAVAKWLEGLV